MAGAQVVGSLKPGQENRHSEQLVSLQCLRGIAATLVLMYHLSASLDEILGISSLQRFFKHGFVGVDIFFVLSGFVIFYSTRLDQGFGGVSNYIKKRATRIYPIYWLTLIPFYVCSGWGPLKTSLVHTPSAFVGTFLLLFNHVSYDGVSWTLSFELYFYLLYLPCVITRRLFFVPLSVFLIAGVRLIMIPPAFDNHGIADFLFSNLTLEFAFGLLAGWLFQRQQRLHYSPYLHLICISVCWLYFASRLELQRTLGFGTGAFLLVSSSASYEAKLRAAGIELRLPTALTRLGDASYISYLIHLPILRICLKVLANFRLPESFVLVAALLFPAVICLLSIWLHEHLETPLLEGIRARLNPSTRSS